LEKVRNAPGESEWNYVAALDGIRALAIIAVVLLNPAGTSNHQEAA
jgi:peptidoglycan/LPS O-acetylase OafA/YrhL